ncbi:MmcQ/YjbR family DNA-binding protein [Pedobacter sp. MR2016-24]|uniref:MmcQ/YjbR family DNA-binding protein n=1 Tax=Pedobacter sp. MR2016-24 TaxID=2994466 RepID=UPI0022455771|nr:MmcQ/YjbR family DNA-binding protein [Pedobacter sp. MR2016-24]MCX2482742.1 MmcQ/YjbR family DNA-binding protein [Pedobacter sp. MR2016-24]
MDIEILREYCLSLPGTEEDLKWGENLCFMVEQKIYVLASLDTGTLTFKCDPEEFEELTARDGIQQASHFAKTQWITLMDYDVMADGELKKRIAASRSSVIAKLPKKIQEKYSQQGEDSSK